MNKSKGFNLVLGGVIALLALLFYVRVVTPSQLRWVEVENRSGQLLRLTIDGRIMAPDVPPQGKQRLDDQVFRGNGIHILASNPKTKTIVYEHNFSSDELASFDDGNTLRVLVTPPK